MARFHVTYYYLATGMEGRADSRDYGIVEAESADEAKDIVARRRGSYSRDKCYRHWGLTAKRVSRQSLRDVAESLQEYWRDI